ncbi:hypothetical protein [Candidatus Parabeggiatoa sp. HSG14]|uniref:hypothetical protein n=1 Tax=Candidatus Parabeggiatoa sp. HSG14 TaxID=3055593 RepID=UPI0025A826C3|nr:hypothetical protein [Thiotrichales bacterium HSG14]
MDDFPRQKLRELIEHHGAILSKDAKRCESFLQEACGDKHQPEIFLLTNAIKEGVVKDLLNPSSALLQEALANYLVQKLCKNLSIEKIPAEWAVQSWKMALFQPQKSKNQFKESKALKSFKRLSPLNPLDHLRLLWWILVKPQQLKIYRQIFGESDEKQVGKWLVSTLIWWPLFVPTLALGLEWLPHFTKTISSEAYLLISIVLVGSWLLTGKFGNKGKELLMNGIVLGVVLGIAINMVLGIVNSMILGMIINLILGVVLGITLAIMLNLQPGMVLGIASGVMLGITGFIVFITALIVTNIVGGAIENSLKTGNPALIVRLAFILLIAIHLFLIQLWFLSD